MFRIDNEQQEEPSLESLDELNQRKTTEPVWNLVRLDGLKVLLVEDTPDARVYISRLLLRAGAHVLTASSAQEARQVLLHDEPDVIISDIAMPDEDGLSFLRKLRTEGGPSGARIPAMALTAFTARCRKRGARTTGPAVARVQPARARDRAARSRPRYRCRRRD